MSKNFIGNLENLSNRNWVRFQSKINQTFFIGEFNGWHSSREFDNKRVWNPPKIEKTHQKTMSWSLKIPPQVEIFILFKDAPSQFALIHLQGGSFKITSTIFGILGCRTKTIKLFKTMKSWMSRWKVNLVFIRDLSSRMDRINRNC